MVFFLAAKIIFVTRIMNESLQHFYQDILSKQSQISAARKEELEQLAEHIKASIKKFGFAKIISVCTHNSRRSQLMEILLRFVADQQGIENIMTFSGGTEGTAFNHRSVAALRHFGFQVPEKEPGRNPKYLLAFGDGNYQEQLFFSKKYDNAYNPQQDFIAVMVCTEADADCPVVLGAFKRLPLPYVDPKVADDTPQESQSYQGKVQEIGREMAYLVSNL